MSLKPPGFISLRTRFMALAVVLTLGSSAIWGGWAWVRERRFLEERLAREGTILVGSMAIPIINALLYEELGLVQEGGLLDNFIADIMANPQLEPLYAMVLDRDGRVLAHNRLPEYGKILRDDLSRSALAAKAPEIHLLHFEGRHASDFSAPLAIAGKRWGALRVGVSREPLLRELKLLAGRILLFSSLISIGALAIFFLVGKRLAAPLVELASRMERQDLDQAQPLAPGAIRRDEIGLLQQSFDHMVNRLRRSEELRQASHARMLEQERLSTVGMIVSGVAHEVNNPLAGIQGALYQIRKKGGAQVQRYATLVEQEVARIGKLVGQLLDLSRAGTPDMERIKSKVFFEELVLFAGMALKSKSVKFSHRDDCPPLNLELDRDKIHQVVLNLVLNAVDAAGATGTILIRARREKSSYLLEVCNSGEQIADQLKERIFEPFFTTKEPGRGSGIGLAISRGIAESHHGSLELCDPPDGYSVCFGLRLPLGEEYHEA